MFRLRNFVQRSSFFTRHYSSLINKNMVRFSISNKASTGTAIYPYDTKGNKLAVDYLNPKVLEMVESGEADVSLIYSPENEITKNLLVNTKKTELDSVALRKIIFQAIKELQNSKITEASLNLDLFSGSKLNKLELIDHIVRTTSLTAYSFDQYKEKKVS